MDEPKPVSARELWDAEAERLGTLTPEQICAEIEETRRRSDAEARAQGYASFQDACAADAAARRARRYEEN